jgi:hypothetical protein
MSTFKMVPNTALSNLFFPNATFSPFSTPARDVEVPADAPEGSYTYALVKSAPEVPAEECEVEALAIEVMIRWGDSLLHVAHLTPPRAFHVGEAEGEPCDFSVPAEKLGVTRAPLVLVGAGGAAYVVLLPGAKGAVEIGGRRMTVAQAIASGEATPCAELAGAHCVALPLGARARLTVGDFDFEVSAGKAGRRVAGRVELDRRSLPFAAMSAVLHVGLLGAMAVLMPPLAMADEEGVNAEQRYVMAQTLSAIAERELAEAKDAADTSQPADAAGGTGAASVGESGAAGSPTSRKTNGRFEIEGPKDNADVRISRSQAIALARDFGMVGLLNAGVGSDPNALTAPWGGVDTLGSGPKSVLGNLWGATIDEAGGAGGLGLSGVGEGGGGPFAGVGMGMIGTIGHGAGLGDNQGFGPGHGGSSDLGRRGHKVSSPRMTIGNTVVSGRIPPEVIQRIVRQNFGRFRLCYENGLRTSPNLAGRVSVAFVIGRDGAVSAVQNGGSDLPDAGVVSCVVRSFYGLSFPAPEGGIVTVTYPILLSPAGS